MIGLSHILLMRKNYSKVNKLSDVDYKIFLKMVRMEYWIIYYIN